VTFHVLPSRAGSWPLPTNTWLERLPRYKCSSVFGLVISDEDFFVTFTTGFSGCSIKILNLEMTLRVEH
jgi:hypothetical protein